MTIRKYSLLLTGPILIAVFLTEMAILFKHVIIIIIIIIIITQVIIEVLGL